MHKFKVGDRVRVTRVEPESKFPQLAGAEGVVIALDVQNARGTSGRVQVDIQSDSNWALLPENLEPILPPKQQETITWDEACFDREGKFRQEIAA